MASSTLLLEKRLFFKAPQGLAAFAVLIVLTLIAGVAGRAYVERIHSAQSEFASEKNDALAEWRETLSAIESGEKIAKPYDARPMEIRLPAVLPPAPLGDFATSEAGLHPTTTTLSAWSNPGDLFAEYEFSNPDLLALGSFDINFVAVVLLPLLMIAVSFDILPSERQNGRIKLLTLQAGRLAPGTWARLALRNGALFCVFATVTFCLVMLPTDAASYAQRLADYGVWLFVVALYCLFWTGAIGAANVLLRRSESVAASLFALWAIFVFAVPAIGGALAEAAYPPPSRLAFLSEMRQGEVTAMRETAALTAGFLADHPEMTVSDEKVPGYYASNFLANRAVAERMAPILAAFKSSKHERTQLIEMLQYLSPTLITEKALASISGGSSQRYQAFQDQALSSLGNLTAAIGPSIVAKQRISVEDFDSIQPFAFTAEPTAHAVKRHAAPLLFLGLITGGLFWVIARRLKAPLEEII